MVAPWRSWSIWRLPVRLTHMQNGERGGLEMACTYDIHPRGARLVSFRDVKVGDLITVERGRNKSICQVVWTARSELRAARPVHSGVRRRRQDSLGRRVAANGRAVSAHHSQTGPAAAGDEYSSAGASRTGAAGRATQSKGGPIWWRSADVRMSRAAWNRFPSMAAWSAPAICSFPVLV